MNRSLIFRAGSSFLYVIFSLLIVACSAGSPSHEATAHLEKEVAEALWKTRSASSGRYEFTMRINVESAEANFGPYETTLVGAFDRSSDAAEVFLDLASSIEVVPELGASFPDGVAPEIVHVRTVGPDTWVRARLDDPWSRVDAEDSHTDVQAAFSGQFDELLDLMANATVEQQTRSDVLGINRLFTGYVGPPNQFKGVANSVDDELLDRMFGYKLWLDENGYAVELLVESDFESVLAALGEEGMGTVEMSYHLVWYDLDEAVVLEAPTL